MKKTNHVAGKAQAPGVLGFRGNSHFFLIEDLHSFLRGLDARGFSRSHRRSEEGERIVYTRELSGALTKYYSFLADQAHQMPVQIRVNYHLLKNSRPLMRIASLLKRMNRDYRKVMPGERRTKPAVRQDVSSKRYAKIQHFMQMHGELIDCFRYQGDDRLTEGNHSFNLLIASTPQEQAVCLDFIKALAEALAPTGIVRGRREVDRPRQQRDGWIRRYAEMHKRRGWSNAEIVKEIQRELREGTWNERSRLQYNLAHNTIGKIAGLKITHFHWN